MIDIHSHILPGIDDGADCLETSLRMLRIAEEDGIEKIFATPHFYRGKFEADRETVTTLVQELRVEAKREGIEIEVLHGNEVLLDRDALRLYREGRIATLNSTRYMLIEFPFDGPQDFALDIIYELRLLGVVPIIAHPERYIGFIKRPLSINDFIDEGCLFQLNGGSLSGIFGRDIQRFSERLLENRIINFLGSDAHTPYRRRPVLKEAFGIIEKKYIGYGSVIKDNTEKMTENNLVTFNGERLKEKRSIFNILGLK